MNSDDSIFGRIGKFVRDHLVIIVACLSLLILIIVGFMIYSRLHKVSLHQEADAKQAEYDTMADSVVSEPASVPSVSNDTVSANSVSNNLYMYNRINFMSFTDIPQDEIAGWLYLPDTGIDYIVMKGTENDPYKYLKTDPFGKPSDTGSLFVQWTPEGYKDDHLVVYGHMIPDHDIYFGNLFKFTDEGYALAHKDAYFYENGEVSKYELMVVCDGLDTDYVYFYPYTCGTMDYQWLLDEISEKTVVKLGDLSVNDKMLVLSTCAGVRENQPERRYLVYKFVERRSVDSVKDGAL